jgi:hypothetical protein
MPQLNARQRRQMLDWYVAHGENLAATCAQFGVSRATFYRWRARYAANPTKPLRAQSRRPHTRRGPAWSRAEVMKLCDLTIAHPTWGRGRLTAALTAQTAPPRSPATVGRMLAWIRARCPICRGRGGRHNVLVHALDKDLGQLGVVQPLLPLPPDPEKKALRREQAAIVREARAIIHGHRMR